AAPGLTSGFRPFEVNMKRTRILLADDHPLILEGFRAVLEGEFEVAGLVRNGMELVEAAIRLRPDLILLDMQLPDFDGFEVLRRLRAQPATAQVPCVALSANAMPEDIQRALQAGVADYWTKPLDFKAFVQALDQRLGLSPP
ncbi:MAG: response regulator, partial [Burkholderiales bacterium]|nr:response regulator [Burkholderiales bacterium]